AAAPRGSASQPAGARPLARVPLAPPHRAGDGEPGLAALLRRRDREDRRGLRGPGRAAEPSGAPRLARGGAGQLGLGPEAAPPAPGHEHRLPAVLAGEPGAPRAGSREPPPRARPALPALLGRAQGPGARRLGPARREARRAAGEALPAAGSLGGHDLRPDPVR